MHHLQHNIPELKLNTMRLYCTLLVGLTLSFAFGQKKELKLAQKQFKASKIAEAKATLQTHGSMIEGSGETKLITQYHLLKAKIARSEKEFAVAYENFKLAEANPSLKNEIAEEVSQLTVDIVNAAIAESEAKDFINSAKNLYLAYTIDPVRNIDYLYYAATNAVNASDYEMALDLYIKLRDISYTGVITKFYATEVATGNEIEISETEYSIYEKSSDFTDLREEKTESKYPEIVKNIALIYSQLGKKEKAIAAVKDAREANPGDISLILTEANFYIELGEKDRYQTLIIEALEQDPNNAVLYFNLGVINGDQGDKAKARAFYEKAIALDNKMTSAYLNLVALILEDEATIVEQMNSLGNSKADNAKYDQLKEQREGIYLECVPILKELIALDESNIEAVKTLKNIYGTIGDNAGFMEMKKLEEKYQ